MKRKQFILATLMALTFLSSCAPRLKDSAESQLTISKPLAVSVTKTVQVEEFPSAPPADCPITTPQDPLFVPPAPYDQLGFEGGFWYGSNSLWTAVPQDGTWRALPHNLGGYTQKVFWWREGYSAGLEPEPALAVTAERLDSQASVLKGSKATNASAGDIGSAMLVGVDLPTLGCWKISGKYDGAELSFVVWVAP